MAKIQKLEDPRVELAISIKRELTHDAKLFLMNNFQQSELSRESRAIIHSLSLFLASESKVGR
jgi:hypothetical protein